MKIRDVLNAKGRGIETAFVWQNISQIIAAMARRNISSVVIVDTQHRPMGIVTDRILVNGVAVHGSALFGMTVSDVMHVPVPTCKPGSSVKQVMKTMTDLRVRHLLVMEDGQMAGLVSIGDLVKFRIRDAELENGVLRDLVPAWSMRYLS